MLRFPQQYKHVGTIMETSCNMTCEVVSRCHAMKGGSYRLRKCVLRNHSIAVSKRLSVLQIYILTKGTFQCGTWSQLPDSLYKKIHTCIMSLYRDISGHYFGNTCDKKLMSDADILFEYEMMSPRTMLRCARIQLFARVVKKAPKVLTELVFDMSLLKTGWTASLLKDLRWLSGHEKLSGMCDYDLGQWWGYIRDNLKTFRKEVRAFSKTRLANVMLEQEGPALQTLTATHACDFCPKVCMTFQALSLHRFKAHGLKSAWRKYLDDVYCPVCLRMFWTRERALNHIRYRSRICKHNMLLRGPVISDSEADVLDAADAESHAANHKSGKRRHHVVSPVVQMPGPLWPIIVEEGRQSSHHELGIGQQYFR